MKAELTPLHGKYYGTEIRFVGDDLNGCGIEVWLRTDNWTDGTMEASERELEAQGETAEEHRAHGHSEDACAVDFSGGHYENAISFRIASIIVDALNNYEQKEPSDA